MRLGELLCRHQCHVKGQLSGGINHLPAGTGQEAVDERRLKRRILQLLEERGLVESHASREGLGDDAFTLGNELWSQPKDGRSAP